MTKEEYGKLSEAIKKELTIMLNSFYIDPKDYQDKKYIWMDKKTFIRKAVYSIVQSDLMPEPDDKSTTSKE
jgi:uncharacterized protein YjbK